MSDDTWRWTWGEGDIEIEPAEVNKEKKSSRDPKALTPSPLKSKKDADDADPCHLPPGSPEGGQFTGCEGGASGGSGKVVGKTPGGNEIREGPRHGEPLKVGAKEEKVKHHEVYSPSGQKLGNIRSTSGNVQTSMTGTTMASGRGDVVRYRAEKIGRKATYHRSYKQALKHIEQ